MIRFQARLSHNKKEVENVSMDLYLINFIRVLIYGATQNKYVWVGKETVDE